MPLPGGATGFTLTGGPYDDPAFQGMSAILTTNVPVTHLATGERLRKSWTVTVDYSGSFTVGPLPFSDDPAFTPNGFTYTLTWQALSYKDTPGNLTFAVPQSAGTTVDFDTLTSAGNGQPALPTTVFSVNGKTGAVTLTASDVGAAPAGSAGAVASVVGQTGAVTGAQIAADPALRGTFVSVLIYSGGAYPARPSGVPGGLVKYIGPVQPTTWLSGDEWVNNS